jgi:hypothetical protein
MISSEESGRAIEQPDASPSDLRIKVGVHDDPTEALAKILGGDPESRALRLHTGPDLEDCAHITLLDGELWGIARADGGQLREGPMARKHVMAGLARADSVEIVARGDAPFVDEQRGGPNV